MSAPPFFPSGQPAAAPPRGVRDLLAALYRQAPIVVACAVVGTAASLSLYALQPRVYSSSAKVWVQTEQQGSPSFLSGIAAYRETPYPDPVNRKIETEIELMLTRANAQSVVERFHIRPEQLAQGALGKLKARFAKPPAAADEATLTARTVDLFLDGLSVEPLRSKTADTSSNVLEVRLDCTDPVLAPQALQAFIDNYLQLGAQQNRRLGEQTSRVIATQLASAADELRRNEDAIVDLLVKDSGRSALSGATAVAAAGPTAIGSGTVDQGGLRLDLDPSTPAAGAAPVVAALKSQSLELQLRLDEARQLYTDDAENVRSLRAQLAGTQQRLVRTVRENTKLEADLNRLQRQRQLAQERYVELQRKLDQIDLYLRLNPTEAESRVVIDTPDHPGPTAGKKKPVVAVLGPVAGLLLGLLLAGLREFGRDRLRSAREAEWALGAPVLGTLPTLSTRARQAFLAPRTATSAPDSRLAS